MPGSAGSKSLAGSRQNTAHGGVSPTRARSSRPGFTPSALEGRQWDDLSKEEKLEACFRCGGAPPGAQRQRAASPARRPGARGGAPAAAGRRHLDYDNSGYLDETELKAIIRKFNPRGVQKAPSAMGRGPAAFGTANPTLEDYLDEMMELTFNMDSAEFDALCKQVLGAVHLSYLTRQQKLEMAFHKIDGDGDRFLNLAELESFGASIKPDEDPSERRRRARKTMQWMDTDNDGLVRACGRAGGQPPGLPRVADGAPTGPLRPHTRCPWTSSAPR